MARSHNQESRTANRAPGQARGDSRGAAGRLPGTAVPGRSAEGRGEDVVRLPLADSMVGGARFARGGVSGFLPADDARRPKDRAPATLRGRLENGRQAIKQGEKRSAGFHGRKKRAPGGTLTSSPAPPGRPIPGGAGKEYPHRHTGKTSRPDVEGGAERRKNVRGCGPQAIHESFSPLSSPVASPSIRDSALACLIGASGRDSRTIREEAPPH